MKRWHIIGGTAAALAVVGGGAALAAAKLDSPSARSQAIIDDAAGQLGVPSAKLSAALKKAMEDQIQADVTAGTITQEQADALKKKLDSGTIPLIPGYGFRGAFGGHGPGFGQGLRGAVGPFADLTAAATYLGVTADELRSDLQSGKTLAQVTTGIGNGKTVDGLVAAMTAAAKKRFDDAVSAGKISADQAKQLESTLTDRVTALVNGTFKSFMPGFGGRMRHDFGGFGPGGPGPGGGAPPQNPA